MHLDEGALWFQTTILKYMTESITCKEAESPGVEFIDEIHDELQPQSAPAAPAAPARFPHKKGAHEHKVYAMNLINNILQRSSYRYFGVV